MIFKGKRPGRLGVRDGRLGDGPRKPNWVCSQTAQADHFIEPLPVKDDAAREFARLKALVLDLPRTALIEERDNYLYFEFTTGLMRYVDDVEFYCDGQHIHVRSASRLGYSDLGANRKRIESIRSAFES